jgi:hypothetical protein
MADASPKGTVGPRLSFLPIEAIGQFRIKIEFDDEVFY